MICNTDKPWAATGLLTRRIWPASFMPDEGVTPRNVQRDVARSGPRRGITGHQGIHFVL